MNVDFNLKRLRTESYKIKHVFGTIFVLNSNLKSILTRV